MEPKNQPQIAYWEQFIPALLTAWQAAGNPFGVGQHLQLRQLLQSTSPDTPPDALKTILAPIFANNAQAQQDFYQIFDHTLSTTEIVLNTHEKRVTQTQVRHVQENLQRPFRQVAQFAHRQWWSLKYGMRLALIAGFSLIVFSLGIWTLYQRFIAASTSEALDKSISEVFIPVRIDGSLTDNKVCIQSEDPGRGKLVKIVQISPPAQFLKVGYSMQGDEICLNYSGLSTGREVLTYEICHEKEVCQQLRLIFRVDAFQRFMPSPKRISGNFIPSPSRPVPLDLKVSDEKTAPSRKTVETLQAGMDSSSVNFDQAINTMDPSRKIDGVTSTVQIGGRLAYLTPTKGVFIIGIALFIGLLGWWIRRRRQRYSLDHQASKNPPYSWTIRIPTLNEVDLGQVFQNVLREMRQRNEVESSRLDVDRTIKATLQKGGAIDIQYAQATQSRQYLVLIDISTQNNHQAKIFDLLITTLQHNEAPLERFFYDKDPQHCWNERLPNGLSLSHLAHSYQNCQLIICSSGHHLLQPETKESGNWADPFTAWRRRVLLTPRLSQDWSRQEERLAKSFRLLPGTPKGIASLVETLEAVEYSDYRKIETHTITEADFSPIEIPADLQAEKLIALLEAAFVDDHLGQPDDTLLQWIAGCFIPPVLFWDWTLYVGQLLSSPADNHLTLDNLFRIARLPWFIEGKAPENVRIIFLDWLEKNHPHWLLKLRQQWDHILQLEENLPPLGSMAWEGHRVELLLNELLQDPKRRRRRKLELELERLIHGQQNRDTLIIRYLEQQKGPLDNLLSGRFRRFVQEQQDVFWRWRTWTWQVPMLLTLFFVSLFVHYTEPVTVFQFNNYISELAFSPDSKSIFVANGKGSIAMCSVEGTWKQGIKEQDHKVIGLATSADGQTILSGNSNNELSYWDISGSSLYSSLPDNNRLVTDIAFHPLDPFLVLYGYYGNVAELWDLQKEQKLHSFPHNDAVESVTFSPDGQYLFTGSRDGISRLWDQNGNLLQTLEGHTGKVNAVDFSPNGNYLITGSQDNTVKLWSLEGELVHTFKGHKDEILAVAFSPDGSKILTAGEDDIAILWSISDGKRLRVFRGHRHYVSAVAFSPDGRYVLTGDRNGKVKLWHLGEVH